MAEVTPRPPLALLTLVALAVGAVSPAQAARPEPPAKRRSELQSSPSDTALYQEAKRAQAALRASAKLAAQRTEWDKVVQRYRRVVRTYPQSGLSDDALLAIGDLNREMAKRFKAPRCTDEALLAYRQLAAEYPRSRLGEPALFAAYDIVGQTGDRKQVAAAARTYLAAYPSGKNAQAIRASLKRRGPVPAAEPPLPAPPPPGLAQVFGLRFWSGDSSTRVVLDLEKQLPLSYDRLANPDRLFVDVKGARLHPNLADRSFPVGDGLLEQVRVGQNRDSVVRVVLDFKSVQTHQVFYLNDPVRLVIDVRGASPLAARKAPPTGSPARASPASVATEQTAAAAPEAAAAGVESLPLEEVRVADRVPLPESGPPQEVGAPDEIRSSRPMTSLAPAAPPPAAVRRARPTPTIEGPPVRTANARSTPQPAPSATPAPPAPSPPAANRSGQYSLARQLGLQARRIVIDAGHGGHDPGTIGGGGLQEKDLVLDVALRLQKLLRAELGAEVVMTRSTDVFVPLEERTAIANAKGADLFLSIHANSSRNRLARGIETYFLNFAKDAHAESVAARENAISPATLKDLQNLVKAIALNSKIDESRDFAASVQEALVASLRSHDPEMPDRGVHTAPFYVLIGATMPSILAEIAFVSHPGEEKRLKTAEHRERIARSLLEGVRSYLDGLNRTPVRALTAAGEGPRVVEKRRLR